MARVLVDVEVFVAKGAKNDPHAPWQSVVSINGMEAFGHNVRIAPSNVKMLTSGAEYEGNDK